MKIYRGCTYFEAESFSRLKSSRGWKCLPTVWGWNCLGAENVSKLFRAATVLGLKVSPNCSRLKVSRGWKFPRAASVSGLKLSKLKVSQGWKCLSPSGLQVSGGWKCLGCKFLAVEIVSGLKVSSRQLSNIFWIKTSWHQLTLGAAKTENLFSLSHLG